jgi:hypothetical protein
MIARHAATGRTLSISLAPVDDPWHFGVVAVDDDLRIRTSSKAAAGRGAEQPASTFGTWLWEPEVLARIPDDETAVRDSFSERVLFPGIIADGLRVQGFTEDLWVDVGAPDRYLRATSLLLGRTAKQAGRDVMLEDGVAADESVRFSGQVLIGRGTRIGAGARISGPTVIGHDTIIGANAGREASVIWEEARIGAARASPAASSAPTPASATAHLAARCRQQAPRSKRATSSEPGARDAGRPRCNRSPPAPLPSMNFHASPRRPGVTESCHRHRRELHRHAELSTEVACRASSSTGSRASARRCACGGGHRRHRHHPAPAGPRPAVARADTDSLPLEEEPAWPLRPRRRRRCAPAATTARRHRAGDGIGFARAARISGRHRALRLPAEEARRRRAQRMIEEASCNRLRSFACSGCTSGPARPSPGAGRAGRGVRGGHHLNHHPRAGGHA